MPLLWDHKRTQGEGMGRIQPTIAMILVMMMMMLLLPLEPLDLARQTRSCIQVERRGSGGILSLIAAGASCIADSAAKSRTVLGSILSRLFATPASRPAFPFPGSADEALEEVPDGWPGTPPHRISLRWFAPFFSSGGAHGNSPDPGEPHEKIR